MVNQASPNKSTVAQRERERAVGQFLTALVNMLINAEIHPDDVPDVSILVGPRFGIADRDLPLYAATYYSNKK